MAATYGRLTGSPGVCLATLGPGATNFVTAAAYAQLGGMPMLMITGQKPIKKSKQGRFQIINVVDMMRPITKFTRQIVDGNNVPSLVREAFRLATEERPGAVHIELPEDVAAEEAAFKVFNPHQIHRTNANQKSIKLAVELIEEAKMPLLLIGAGANRKNTSKPLVEFIDKTGIYFFNTQMGKGVVDERHSLFLGTAALSSDDFLHCAIERADLIINVGHDVVEKPPFFMEQDGKKVIHINFSPSEIDDVYFPQLDVIGDISNSIEQITNEIELQNHWEFSYYSRIKKEVESHIEKYFDDNRFPLLPQRIVKLVRDHLSDQGILTLDNGVYKIWFARNYYCYGPNTLLLDNALATMGAGLPSAIAAKLVHPERKVISINGDGGFMMNSQEIETAVRLKLDIIILILNDNAFGMIKWKQEHMGFQNFGLDYQNPDFVQYAESYGALGYRATSSQHFSELLESCLNTSGVHVIDVPVDYSLNHPILNVKLKEKTCLL
jgi:acetolactate synthase I/II/III large subunit